MRSIQISAKTSRNGEKKWYYFEWGKAPSERKATGIFTYTHCQNLIQRNYNKEVLALLETKKAQLIIEQQSVGTVFMPSHQFKHNFLDYYTEYVNNNKRKANRHQEGSLQQFKKFIQKERILSQEITENLCVRFRKYLLERLTGKTPADYFSSFKRVIKTATKEGYFHINPAGDVQAKTNPSKYIKDFLEAEEYITLLGTPCQNEQIREAFIVSCYTGLRWCDIKALEWKDIQENCITSRIIQKKTNKPVILTLHPLVKSILQKKIDKLGTDKCNGPVFKLGTANGCNKALKQWMKCAGIQKKITWHCARLSFSILLQDANVDTATVALLMGHTTTRYVHETYKRHRAKDQSIHLSKLPGGNWAEG